MRCASERCRWLVRHFVRVAARRCLEGEQRHSAWCGCGGADRQAHFGRYHAVLHFRRYNIVMSYNAVGAEERSGPLSAGHFFNSASVSSAFKGFITAWPVWSFYRGWDEYKEYASQVGTAKSCMDTCANGTRAHPCSHTHTKIGADPHQKRINESLRAQPTAISSLTVASRPPAERKRVLPHPGALGRRRSWAVQGCDGGTWRTTRRAASRRC